MTVSVAPALRSTPFPLAAAARALPALVALCAAAGLALVAVQQVHRQLADDPQIQLADDAARALAAGAAPARVVPAVDVDLAVGLAPWIAVYDGAGRVLASNGVLDGRMPAPPSGVLEAARATGGNRVTWQPRPGVRSATVSVPVPGRAWVVTAGRSLRETERRTGTLRALALLAWLAGAAGVVAAAAMAEWLARR